MTSTDAHWETFGKVDPYYGVLTDPKYRKVTSDDAVRDEFFSTGEAHVEHMLSIVRKHLQADFAPSRALDFGCGVGRLVIPLARVAREVVGVDVSESMLAEAQRNCARAGVRNVAFVKSDDELSKLTDSFDLLHSHIVFQHIPPARGQALFESMLARLSDNGIGVLHFTYWIPPAPPPGRLRRAYRAVRTVVPPVERLVDLWRGPALQPTMEMNAYDLNRLLWVLQENACHRVHLRFTDHGGPRGVVLYFKKEPLPSI